jgi:hypothetical protein
MRQHLGVFLAIFALFGVFGGTMGYYGGKRYIALRNPGMLPSESRTQLVPGGIDDEGADFESSFDNVIAASGPIAERPKIFLRLSVVDTRNRLADSSSSTRQTTPSTSKDKLFDSDDSKNGSPLVPSKSGTLKNLKSRPLSLSIATTAPNGKGKSANQETPRQRRSVDGGKYLTSTNLRPGVPLYTGSAGTESADITRTSLSHPSPLARTIHAGEISPEPNSPTSPNHIYPLAPNRKTDVSPTVVMGNVTETGLNNTVVTSPFSPGPSGDSLTSRRANWKQQSGTKSNSSNEELE